MDTHSNDMNMTSDVTISSEDAVALIKQLLARTQQLERQVEYWQSMPEKQLAEALPIAMRYLRLHGVVLLNLGTERAENLQDRVENSAARAALTEAWNLANAPLPADVIDQVRSAAKGGGHRW